MIPLAWCLGGAAAALLVTAAVAGWQGYRTGQLEGEGAWRESVAKAGELFAVALEDQQATLERTETALRRSRAETSKRQEKLSDAVRRDPASADWASQRIPDAVRVQLGAGDPDLPGDP